MKPTGEQAAIPSADDAIRRRLLEIGMALVAERHTEPVLERILHAGIELTGARYAAIGVLDERRAQLARFITAGLDHDELLRTIGELPRGRGVLGVLVEDPRPLRLADVGSHPQSYGFPPGHPPMRSFLGVPIVIRGQAWGNLYLTEKQGGAQFTETDEDAAVTLAHWAAAAIENAGLYEQSERRRSEAERAVRGLEAARSIADAVAGVDDLAGVLELIAKRGRALVEAQTVLIMLREGDDLVVAASAGEAAGALGTRLPVAGSTSGQVLQRGRPERIADVAELMWIAPAQLGVPGARTALLVPMLHRGIGIGLLAAFDRGSDADSFSVEHEQLMHTFSTQAANAVAIRRSVEAGRLRSAIEALIDRRRATGLAIESELDLDRAALAGARLPPEVETAAYRIVQEALTNVVKHARATSVSVTLRRAPGELLVAVRDDGVGFEPDARAGGFGLTGMRERVYLAGGTLQIAPRERGTLISARLPIPPERTDAGSGADQAAPKRELHELRPGREPELAVDPGAVGLDRPSG